MGRVENSVGFGREVGVSRLNLLHHRAKSMGYPPIKN